MNKPPSRGKKSTISASSDGTKSNSLTKKEILQEENPASATITVTAVEVPELTEQEISVDALSGLSLDIACTWRGKLRERSLRLERR